MPDFSYIVTYPPGTEDLAREEIISAGGVSPVQKHYRYHFSGTRDTGYRLCLHSRIINRVLVELLRVRADDTKEFYRMIYACSWEEILRSDASIGIRTSGVNNTFRHTTFTSQSVKDAIVDRLREKTGSRPDVKLEHPGCALEVLMGREEAIVCLDMSGEPLFRRVYRKSRGEAPLKENIAAAMLMRARWPEDFSSGILIDPMCGSGTLAIEAALMALHIPPGTIRDYFGFFGWKGHDEQAWNILREAARLPVTRSSTKTRIYACDSDPRMVAVARKNAEAAGLQDVITFQCEDFFAESSRTGLPSGETGLVVMNPPYGKRIHGEGASIEDTESFYKCIGETLQKRFGGWKASILTSPPSMSASLGLAVSRSNSLKNGPLDCRVSHCEIFTLEKRRELTEKREKKRPEDLGSHAQTLYNRLVKNRKTLSKWLSSNAVSSWRLYDKDIPEYAVAIDLYENNWLHVQEYSPPKTIDPAKAEQRLREIEEVLLLMFDVPKANIFFKTRSKMKGTRQYEKKQGTGDKFIMREGGLRFYINLGNYLDSGIFLDHREVRNLVFHESGKLPPRSSFLNLFSYTGTSSVYAARAGCVTTSVDSSSAYQTWAEENFRLNGIDPSTHFFEKEGCFEWLEKNRGLYDLILLDPPTFSNTSDRRRNFDIQTDHTELLALSAARLKKTGLLIFSTNFRKFAPDFSGLHGFSITEITDATLPKDFRRKIHRAFTLRHSTASA